MRTAETKSVLEFEVALAGIFGSRSAIAWHAARDVLAGIHLAICIPAERTSGIFAFDLRGGIPGRVARHVLLVSRNPIAAFCHAPESRSLETVPRGRSEAHRSRDEPRKSSGIRAVQS
jgi:hypothetical protein